MPQRFQSLVGPVLRTVLPSLRVVALVYTGLSGIAALVVVVTAAIAPRAPVVQQVAEPARQAVSTLVQPTGDVITSIVAPPATTLAMSVELPAQPTPAPFVDSTSLEVTIEESEPPVVEFAPAPVVVLPPVRRAIVAAPVEEVAGEMPADEGEPEDLVADETPAPTESEDVAPRIVQAPNLEQEGAAVEAPKALPTVAPTPAPETPLQAKARMDAANQAAIDAAKAAAAKAKADADAANQAAIDAQKAAIQAAKAKR